MRFELARRIGVHMEHESREGLKRRTLCLTAAAGVAARMFEPSAARGAQLLSSIASSSAQPRRHKTPTFCAAATTGGIYMVNYYLPPAGSSTPWWPSWSPDGKWLAFAMHGSIWKIKVGDASAEEWVYAKEYLSSPEWSPDGKWLVYTADSDGQSINLMR